jgi:5-methylcytosine-specific restriction endonuclease McrBC GTP-binding regulatory subunit McrB
LSGSYISEPALDFLLEASTREQELYFFCLDEMNLAHVEYYFSQFLSAFEEERPTDRRITLMSQRLYEELKQQREALTVPAELQLAPNLLFTGTVNIDETTQPISDKVLDRANTIEFFSIDLDKIPQPTVPPKPVLFRPSPGRATRPSSRIAAIVSCCAPSTLSSTGLRSA